jgi:YfiH family protein
MSRQPEATGQGLASPAAALRDAGLDWIVPDWPAPADVGAIITTRHGGVSAGACATMNLARHGEDDPVAVAENRRRLDRFLPATPVWLDQVHGTTVVTLDRAPLPDAPLPVADAAVTRDRGIVCAVRTADCLPVLFAARAGNAIGIAHAGWRGLAAGVLEATVAAMAALGAPAGDIVAWLGPGIGPGAFEVGGEVRAAFCDADPGAAPSFAPHGVGKWRADLYALARRRLAGAGISRVCGGGYCTASDAARFFSYRRDRTPGRMAALIWRAPLAA